jgi:mannose-6-phosphate isomerase
MFPPVMDLANHARWMGTYPELPSYVLETGEDLQDVLDKHPDELIGKTVARKFNHTKLPYLPKVLSIAKALPLQLHPVRFIPDQCGS